MSRPLLFWDVDTQVDFIDPDGKLHVPEAEKLRTNLGRLTEAARRHKVPQVASADDHEPGDAELSDDPDFEETYPPHCLRGTEGAEKVAETRLPEATEIGHQPLPDDELERLADQARPVVLIKKKRFDVFTNANTEALVRRLDPERIVLYGVATDVCNRFAIEGLLARGYDGVALVTDAAAPIDPEKGEQLLVDWQRRGVELITTDELIAELEKDV